MNRNKSFINLLSLIIVLIFNSKTIAQVSVKLQQPPPYQFKVEQFWKFVLINNSDKPVNVFLKGTATESLQGKIVEATSSIITLQRGVKYITGRDLAPFTISESNDRYKNIILNTGSIPSGGYDICVSVFDAANGREIATDCIQASVENFNRMELITPMDGEVLGVNSQEEIEINEPKNVLWSGFISELTKKKKDMDWDEAVGDLKRKKDHDMDDAVFDLKKKKDKDWDEAVGDLKKKKDYDWDEAVGDLKKKKDKDWDEAVGDLKKKKDYDWDEAVGDFKKKIDKNDDRYIAELKKIFDKYSDQNSNKFNLVSNHKNIRNNIPSIIFSWLPPVPVPPDARINYRLKLVEIYGNQSVHSAMASNPVYYQSLKLSSTMLRYPVAAKPLNPGSKYAWSVEAFVDDFKIQESEIRSFEIQGNNRKVRYDTNNAGTVQWSKNIIADNSGLPSGLSSYNRANLGTSNSNYFSIPASIDLFGSEGNFVFSGDAKFSQTSSSKPAQFSQLPSNYRSLEINPRLSFYEIPFAMNIYLSSLNDPNKQSLNSVSFVFDIERLKSKIRDRISERTNELQSSAEQYLSKLNDLKAQVDPDKIRNQLTEKANEIKSSADSTLGKLNEQQSLADPDKIKEQLSQKINEAQASADSSLEKLKEIEELSDPSNLTENAEQLGLISSAEKFFLNIKTFGLGRTYPEYSDFTVSGVPVDGFNLAYNPGIFYFAVAAGNNAKGINDVSFKRSFLAGQLGVGEKEYSHLFFTFLKMKDDPNSILISTPSAGSLQSVPNPLFTPQENVVLGSEAKLKLFDALIELNGEGAVSGFTRDLNEAEYTSDSYPAFAKSFLTPKLSSSFDYAWKGKIVFNNQPSATFISLGAKKIGPGFISLGAPNIKQDQFQYDINFDQKFADRKITMKTFLKVYNDNLIDWKQFTTTTISYGVNVSFYFPQMPFVQINYSPYSQSNDNINVNQKMETSFDMFSLMSGYTYQFSGMFASTILSFNGQWQNAKFGINETEFSNTTFMLNQNLNFEFPLSLSSTLSLSQLKFIGVSSSMSEFNLNGDYQINANISANIGGTISNEENLTKRVMISLGSNINLYQWLRFQLQGNISDYKDLSGGSNNYTDSMMLVTALLNW